MYRREGKALSEAILHYGIDVQLRVLWRKARPALKSISNLWLRSSSALIGKTVGHASLRRRARRMQIAEMPLHASIHSVLPSANASPRERRKSTLASPAHYNPLTPFFSLSNPLPLPPFPIPDPTPPTKPPPAPPSPLPDPAPIDRSP